MNSSIAVSDNTVKTSPEWEGFSRGDPVKIVGERGYFEFVGFCERNETGEQWIALFGGDKDPNGRRGFRYVDPKRVKQVKKKGRNV